LACTPRQIEERHTIGKGVTNISDEAFIDCFGLKTVYFLGNPPSLGGSNVFRACPATAYYLPGSNFFKYLYGTYGGLPIALWPLPQPVIENSGFAAGCYGPELGFDIFWATNRSIVVEACTNLTNPVWKPVSTNTFTSGISSFTDPQWTNYPSRFYRVTAP